MAVMTRTAVIDMMRRTGNQARIAEAEATLPDLVDSDKDVTLLNDLGLNRGDLMEDIGSSP